MRRLALVAIVLMLSGADAIAQDMSAEDELRLLIGQRLQVGSVDVTRKAAHEIFNQANVDGRGVSKVGYELAANIAAAQMRSAVLMEFLRLDLDGDMRVTRAEVEASLAPQARRSLNNSGIAVEPTPEQARTILDKLVAKMMEADANADGVIEVAEMLAVAKSRTAMQHVYQGQQLVPLGLDSDGDGVVSRQEYDRAVDAVLKSFDSDGDGQISQAEREAALRDIRRLQQQQSERQAAQARRAQMAEAVKACAQPPVAAGARVIVVGAYQGAALSSVRIGGGDDVVHVANIDIMDGAGPLHVLAASHGPVIWTLSGRTDRIARFVVSARSGVVGVPRDRVGFLAKSECLPYFTASGDAESKRAVEAATALLGGRAPDAVIGYYSLGRLRLPLGQHMAAVPPESAVATTAGGKAMLKEFLRFNPGGLSVIDPATVVAAAPVAAYDLLPSQAGLMQLIDAGLLEVASHSRAIQLGGTRIVGDVAVEGAKAPLKVELVPNALRIKGAMDFPAGLHGAHSVTFLLPRGVPMPRGDRGHSRIRCEDSGESAETLKSGEKCR